MSVVYFIKFNLATSTCTAMGITKNLLDGCIYDIIITGDVTMAQQDTLQISMLLLLLT